MPSLTDAMTPLELASWAMLATGISCFFILLFVDAPYGRFSTGRFRFGPLVSPRLGWFLMESPAWLTAAATFAYWGTEALTSINGLFLCLFLLHYFNRSLLFPYRLVGGSRMPMSTMASALAFCTVNGTMQGMALGTMKIPIHSTADQVRVLFGVLLFLFGFHVNLSSDSILRRLRAAGGGYGLPRGGAFEYVSAANYLGELIEWGGFALAVYSFPSFTFFVFSFLNLFPRSLAYHRWYRRQFKDYPSNRKAIIPFII